MPDSTTDLHHAALAVVLAVREGHLAVLLRPGLAAGDCCLPGGELLPGETLEASLGRHVEIDRLAHLEQLETLSDPQRHPGSRELATTYLGLAPSDVELGGEWHGLLRLPRLADDHEAIVLAARARLRAKLSYTNVGFALAPQTFSISELRDIYAAALGHDVSATNLQRVLVRRGVLEPTGSMREPGRAGGRPAALFRFASRRIAVTDEFAALRPPAR